MRLFEHVGLEPYLNRLCGLSNRSQMITMSYHWPKSTLVDICMCNSFFTYHMTCLSHTIAQCWRIVSSFHWKLKFVGNVEFDVFILIFHDIFRTVWPFRRMWTWRLQFQASRQNVYQYVSDAIACCWTGLSSWLYDTWCDLHNAAGLCLQEFGWKETIGRWQTCREEVYPDYLEIDGRVKTLFRILF